MKRTRKNRKTQITILVFFILIILIYYYFFIILPIIKTYSAQQVQSITEKTVNTAVSNVINRTINYGSLMNITYNNKGEISAFSANQHEINSISREIVKETQFQISVLDKDILKINIGTFSGIPFFTGKGPRLALNIVPIGVVSSKFTSEFKSVGINMTKHTLFLYVDVHVSIVMPIQAFDVFSSTQVILAENIIVGNVPNVYLDGNELKGTISSAC